MADQPPAPETNSAEPDTDPERRQHPRHPCPTGLRALVGGPALGAQPLPATVIDVSRGGLALLLDAPLPAGTALGVGIEAWTNGRFLRCRVVHTSERLDGWMHGCQFADPLHPAELLDLLDLVARLSEASEPPKP